MASQVMFTGLLTPPLTTSKAIVTCLVLLFTHRLWIITYRIHFHPLRHYPGPKVAAATKLYRLYFTTRGEGASLPKRLHDRYGAIVRIGPDELSYIDSRAWKDIHGFHVGDRDAFTKDLVMYGPDIRPNVWGLIRADDAGHSRQRRIFTHAFSDRALRGQQLLIKGYVDTLMTKLHVIAERQRKDSRSADSTLDVTRLYTFTSFDIMADLTFGESLGMLSGESYVPWVSLIEESLRYSGYTLILRAYPLLGYLLTPLIPKSIKAMREEHINFAIKRVDQRLQNGSDRGDIWSLVERHAEQDNISREEMYSSSYEFLIAGSETTASLLSGLTYFLCKNEDKMNRVLGEVRALGVADLTISKLQGLKFLQACIEETMRLYPPVAGALGRVKQMGGTNICGKWVPEGTSVGIPHMAAYHSATNFTDPMEFAPERWLPEAPDRFRNDNKEVFQPFLYGPRNCLGKNLAYHENWKTQRLTGLTKDGTVSLRSNRSMYA
ncbi:Averantin oxidoreductase [Colletotrichum higginsianum IMI 349063]|uniref:Averantin oxidoreductase n=1 Tax=Colletotrichum higginsianum (strain IMI 349063) TaxID=759273 RepID=A0A1B7XTC9_COLHI|nr:Averantin oxidoreductase [Colletotrichum higginsianum IMI 349063]OBR03029.1 Averantin oxidoreductase [Colletotrichum higginsianum IMI 349063]